MNLFAILDQLAELDPELPGRPDPRRAVFRRLRTGLGRAAQATAPVLLAGLFERTYAGSTAADPIELLNYALQLKTLTADFYGQFLGTGLIPAGNALVAIQKIKQQEDAHVALLQRVLTALNGTAGPPSRFRATVFQNNQTYAGLLTIAQVLEDLSVRAYKGRVPDLPGLTANVSGLGSVNLLNVALQIHSVEARHAAQIRLLRAQTPWINPTEALASNAVYQGATPESNTLQSNTALTGGLGAFYNATDVGAAFDEPLTKAEVLDPTRAGGFIQ